MISEEAPQIPTPIRRALRKEVGLAQGRLEALEFVWDCAADLVKIREKIAELEELLFDPNRAKGSMAPGASPRVYREGYLAGLKAAVDMISKVIVEEEKQVV